MQDSKREVVIPLLLEPWCLAPLEWLTSSEYARRLGRPHRTIQRWCRDGTFRAFHVRTYQGPNGRWWIHGIPTP